MYPENEFAVITNDAGVTCRRPGGLVEFVAWEDLRAVLIETTDEGPFSVDVFWILVGGKESCVVPQGAPGEQEMLKRLQVLPGFDNQAVIEAMLCTDNRRFLCWERPTQKDS